VTQFLLDTSTVSAAIWKRPDPGVLVQLSKHGGECAICAPVWHELHFGVRRLSRGKRRTSLEAFLEEVVRPTLPILPYDARAAEWHGEERARLERAGRVAPFVDGQVAAIAVTSGIPLITANPTDFKWFKGLTVQNWVGAQARSRSATSSCEPSSSMR
jgi:tRNA(fMet)-specific endonuclease VapC